MYYTFIQEINLRYMILLDSDSTDAVFCNPKYVTNIRDNTNGGPMRSAKSCDVSHLCTHWYNANSIINVISLADMVKYHRIALDSDKQKVFMVHFPTKIIRFK